MSAFIIFRGLCACTENDVVNVSFGSKVGLRTFGCVSMGSEVLFILRSRYIIFHRVWSEQSASCFVWMQCKIITFVQEKNYMYVWLYVFLGCTCGCRCNCDIINVRHDLNWCLGWW